MGSSQSLPPSPPLFKLVTFMGLSRAGVNADDWRDLVYDKWDLIAIDNAKIVIVSGTHGDIKGNLLRAEKDAKGKLWDGSYFLKEDKEIIEDEIKIKKAKDIKDRNIEFIVVDIWDCANDDGEIDSRKVGEMMRKISPTTVILAFCYSEMSKLCQILEAEGIYANLYLQVRLCNLCQSASWGP